MRLISQLCLVALLHCPITSSAKEVQVSTDEQMQYLAGQPDVKPGLPYSKVVGLVWSRQFQILSMNEEQIVANLSTREGDALLPYISRYDFKDGKLLRFKVSKQKKPLPVSGQAATAPDMLPSCLIDRHVTGSYAFRVCVGWRLHRHRTINGDGFTYELNQLVLPLEFDPELETYIPSLLLWYVFARPERFDRIDDVINAEEKRMKATGWSIDRKERVSEKPDTFQYYDESGRTPYRVCRIWFAVFDGRGFAIRLNTTPATFDKNLARYEKFLHDFQFTKMRTPDPDIESIRVKDNVVELIGGVTTQQELETLEFKTVIPKD